MGMNWTDEQRQVIELQNRNILVSAAAGSGKTAVLVERIIKMLTRKEDPVDVDRLLVVTFTEAAAAEMRERIGGAIERELKNHPADERLNRQATLVHHASITTIHSFCLSVIRDHFMTVDLEPGLRIAEEGELKLLEQDVLKEMLESKYTAGEEHFLNLVEAYGSSKSDKKIEEEILSIRRFSKSFPLPEVWLEKSCRAYESQGGHPGEETPCMDFAINYTKKVLKDVISSLQDGRDLCLSEGGPLEYMKALEEDLLLLQRLEEETTFAGLFGKINNIRFTALSRKKQEDVDEEKKERVKVIRNEGKKAVTKLQETFYFSSPKDMAGDNQKAGGYVRVLTDLVKEFETLYQAGKKDRGIIDFTDMEHYAFRILNEVRGEEFVPSEIAKEYQEQFREIIIDEYQDSNLIQEAILTAVSTVRAGKNNMFMVGDVKQSIYRFRLSRPELFMEKYHRYSQGEAPEQRIDLHRNFRSRQEVLSSVNTIFHEIMDEDLGGITYDHEAALYPGADFPDTENAKTEILLADTEVFEEEVIAGRIHDLVHSHKVTDKETGLLRQANYGDIVILIRSMKNTAEVIAKKLEEEGIPAHVETREGYFAALEVKLILSYLQVLNNGHQDIPLAAVLTSCFGDVSYDELAKIRGIERQGSFAEAVEEYINIGEEETLKNKLKTFYETLNKMRDMAVYTSTSKMLRTIIQETGYGDYMAAMPGGKQRTANLEMLIVKAENYEKTSYKGIYNFVRYIEQLKKYDVDYGEANINDQQSDTVRIMSIHKSKGLEFPIVFVTGMGRKFNMADTRSPVILSSKYGIGVDAVYTEARRKTTTLLKNVMKTEEKLETLGEEMRILYVALTRAREKLIMTGKLDHADEKLLKYRETPGSTEGGLGFYTRTKAGCALDYVLYGISGGKSSSVDIKVVSGCDSQWKGEGGERLRSLEAVRDRAYLENWNGDKIYDQEYRELLVSQLQYEYPYRDSEKQKQKYTVSELKKHRDQKDFVEEEDDVRMYGEPRVIPLIPDFLQGERKLTGGERGTAYHRVMELIDFSRDWDRDHLEGEIKRYCSQHRMTSEDAGRINIEEIIAFLRSPEGSRLREAAKRGKVWREQPFVLGINRGDQEDLTLIQGVIDTYFEEEDGMLVLIDYKSDRLLNTGDYIEKYSLQLKYYEEALERMTEKKVKETIIYSFTLNRAIYCGGIT